jgi:hypothetical protein
LWITFADGTPVSGWYLTITGDQLLERPSAQQGARPSATTISGTAYPISDHSVEL